MKTFVIYYSLLGYDKEIAEKNGVLGFVVILLIIEILRNVILIL